uniref:Uncharacterized protein n=1 Tax=Picea glauca TaxID=3330 RepID=A0A101LYF4_PICGL|nr:hypothetical protein ABT39_MTgene5689 [Picea glauca]
MYWVNKLGESVHLTLELNHPFPQAAPSDQQQYQQKIQISIGLTQSISSVVNMANKSRCSSYVTKHGSMSYHLLGTWEHNPHSVY